jgi:hypothetical protein
MQAMYLAGEGRWSVQFPRLKRQLKFILTVQEAISALALHLV